MEKKPLAFGRVSEVTETEECILMPLSPMDDRASHFCATIIYDLVKLGYEAPDIVYYFKDFLKNNSIPTILAYIQDKGRMIWEDVSQESKKEIVVGV